MTEKWAQIEGFEGFYEVSDLGNVRSVERIVPRLRFGKVEKMLRKSSPVRQNKNHKGYPEVTLSREATRSCFRVHRLVAAAFVDGETKEQVNHINSIRGDNRAVNLEWCSCQENVAHAIANDPNNWGRKPVIALDGDKIVHSFQSVKDAARAGFHGGGVSAAATGRLRTHAGLKWVYASEYFADLV